MGQTNFAKMAGWSDSKVSRLNIQDMAVTFVLLEKVWETSLIREVARQAVEAVMPGNKKRPACKTGRSEQIQMDF
ncbi:CII protein [Salmonella enterica]|nr:CII protein [Salmonella enterica]EKP2190310.1 CII protein [Salmonella enterica]